MNTSRRALLATTLMLGTAAASSSLRPRARLANVLPKLDLERDIPRSFGHWKVDPLVIPISVSPDVQAKLDEIYNQTLLRTYIDTTGHRIMLSIAYGADQSGDRTQVHRPEFCYTAQGFQLSSARDASLLASGRTIPVRRLVATNAARKEPITYWVTVGEHTTLPGLDRKLLQVRFGVAGQIPDGLLFRVSSIDDDARDAFEHHQRFVGDMLSALHPQVARRIAGVQFE